MKLNLENSETNASYGLDEWSRVRLTLGYVSNDSNVWNVSLYFKHRRHISPAIQPLLIMAKLNSKQ